MSSIVIATGSMPFGPHTLTFKSLGGSETAALMLGKALAAAGHQVTHFCSLPAPGQPDFFPGGPADDKVSYAPIQAFAQFMQINDCDLQIVTRDPNLAAVQSLARKKVLWMHDIATKQGMQKAFEQMEWLIDEVWTVSEWHRQQVHKATGYPLKNIVALRNGIVPCPDVIPFVRNDKTLIYASRPERGLENLIKPGGIMDLLPEYKLVVAMYDHFPDHMREYYQMIFARMKEMPNVEYVGSKTQTELRSIIADATAYIYPTQFEETSCILARECIEQHTPFLTTREGALPETLGLCGSYFEDWCTDVRMLTAVPEKGSLAWCQAFAQFVRETLADQDMMLIRDRWMTLRTDLYWDGVAEKIGTMIKPEPARMFSRLYSLLQDGDVMAARAYAKTLPQSAYDSPAISQIVRELFGEYKFVESEEAMAQYYENIYASKKDTPESETTFHCGEGVHPRWKAIAAEVAKLPAGSAVFEYGCGSGHVLAPLAKKFPAISFFGCDYSPTAVAVINQGAVEHNLPNLNAFVNGARPVTFTDDARVDLVICTEVLEHAIEPWTLLQQVESLVKPGGRVVLTTPFGAWEPLTFEKPGRYHERAHLWHFDKALYREMAGEKKNETWLGISVSFDLYLRPVGNLIYCYDADHQPTKPVDALAKAKRHFPRQTTAAAIIAYNNEDTIIRTLNSLDHVVQYVQIALGPSTDHTREYVEKWFSEHQYMYYNIIDVPKIEAWKFGFDDARNASIAGLGEFEWVFWIDTDEYLSGDFRKYLRNNCLDAYLVAQHHFTVEPRGRGAEIDRPARLFRWSSAYKAKGHIHEHFEVPEGGPGRCYYTPDLDIGHVGYVNEKVRKDRFDRNFPFLKWDHEVGSDRKLHHFLWFRDLVHQMRFEYKEKNVPEAMKLANEAKEYYNAHTEDMAAFGPGMFYALQYMVEVNSLLGIGVPVELTVKFNDRAAVLASRFDNYDALERVFKQLMKPEFEERLSRYYG